MINYVKVRALLEAFGLHAALLSDGEINQLALEFQNDGREVVDQTICPMNAGYVRLHLMGHGTVKGRFDFVDVESHAFMRVWAWQQVSGTFVKYPLYFGHNAIYSFELLTADHFKAEVVTPDDDMPF